MNNLQKRISKEKRKEMSFETQHQKIVAVACIRDSEGRILFQRRVDENIATAHDKWEFPGGKVEFGEDPRDAVVRECREEIGCTIEVIRLLPLIKSNMWTKNNGDKFHALLCCFEARIQEGIPHPADSKVKEVRWYTKEEITALDVLPGATEFISLL